MTNKEILQASLLDILFDNRNKDYGAYNLRRHYNHRLIIALGSAISIATIVFMSISFGRRSHDSQNQVAEVRTVTIAPIDIPVTKPVEPAPKKEITKPVEKFQQEKFTSKIKIEKDNILKKTEMPVIKDLSNKIVSNTFKDGEPSTGSEKGIDNTNKNSGSGNNTTQSNTETIFKPEERNPEFPGGSEALRQFLRNNLTTPDELEAGDKKMVQVRFKVGIDGMVSNIEIIQSGGTIFDKEVIRVCKKMPRWKPAFQNGNYVAVNYIIPVTFIGVEQ